MQPRGLAWRSGPGPRVAGPGCLSGQGGDRRRPPGHGGGFVPREQHGLLAPPVPLSLSFPSVERSLGRGEDIDEQTPGFTLFLLRIPLPFLKF